MSAKIGKLILAGGAYVMPALIGWLLRVGDTDGQAPAPASAPASDGGAPKPEHCNPCGDGEQ